jgi:hypothetical protein
MIGKATTEKYSVVGELVSLDAIIFLSDGNA